MWSRKEGEVRVTDTLCCVQQEGRGVRVTDTSCCVQQEGRGGYHRQIVQDVVTDGKTTSAKSSAHRFVPLTIYPLLSSFLAIADY